MHFVRLCVAVENKALWFLWANSTSLRRVYSIVTVPSFLPILMSILTDFFFIFSFPIYYREPLASSTASAKRSTKSLILVKSQRHTRVTCSSKPTRMRFRRKLLPRSANGWRELTRKRERLWTCSRRRTRSSPSPISFEELKPVSWKSESALWKLNARLRELRWRKTLLWKRWLRRAWRTLGASYG